MPCKHDQQLPLMPGIEQLLELGEPVLDGGFLFLGLGLSPGDQMGVVGIEFGEINLAAGAHEIEGFMPDDVSLGPVEQL